jgi:predicted nicotinamide N-methyase
MPGYQVKIETITIGGLDYQIRSLLDLNQYADPLGEAARAGISPATWPLFGQVWPSARVLALAMNDYELRGKRVLEIGAGLGLASLVIHRRAGDMTVSDCHPLSRGFMDENLRLNELGPMKYQTGNWGGENPGLGLFELIIGSDVLYERNHPELLAAFISRHSAASVEVVIVDPDRGNRPKFCREMQNLGFAGSQVRASRLLENGAPYKGRILSFQRTH